jgi:hypothetical protein
MSCLSAKTRTFRGVKWSLSVFAARRGSSDNERGLVILASALDFDVLITATRAGRGNGSSFMGRRFRISSAARGAPRLEELHGDLLLKP